jgi:hypothetical protein
MRIVLFAASTSDHMRSDTAYQFGSHRTLAAIDF